VKERKVRILFILSNNLIFVLIAAAKLANATQRNNNLKSPTNISMNSSTRRKHKNHKKTTFKSSILHPGASVKSTMSNYSGENFSTDDAEETANSRSSPALNNKNHSKVVDNSSAFSTSKLIDLTFSVVKVVSNFR
jgi:hypothetical protein